MKKLLIMPLFLFLLTVNVSAQGRSAEKEIRELLDDFLYGASVGDAAAHDRFWAEDLIYTSSAGERRGKEEIMAGFEEDQRVSEDPDVLYTSEDVVIRIYGNTAVLTFTLVATPQKDPDAVKSFYYNSGVLVKRGAQWKVINWQATSVPTGSQ